MLLSILWQVPQLALAGATKNPDDIPNIVVVLTGLSLVFAILLILIAIIVIQGKIFSSIHNKKQAQETEQKAAQAQQPVVAPPVAVAAPATVPAAEPLAAAMAAAAAAAVIIPEIEAGIPGDVVAAISAAVSAASDGTCVVSGVSLSKQPKRGQWGHAGVVQSTEPF